VTELRHIGALLLLALLGGCTGEDRPSVVVYTSVDQHYAEQVLKRFEAETGIRAHAVYDVEASKTTGLVTRLIAEKDRPRADVFWNGEFAQTLLLKERGVLAVYHSPQTERVPAAYRDPDGQWTGTGGRARVIIVNTERVPADQQPSSVTDLLSERWPASSVGLGLPLFGTTATHATALYQYWGRDTAHSFFQQVKARGVRILDGNAMVRDQVAAGELAWGYTDTDDACGALARGAPVRIVVPDQAPGAPGTLIIPNTVAMVAGATNPEAAHRLIDYLLSAQTATALVHAGWNHTPITAGVADNPCGLPERVRGMPVELDDLYRYLQAATTDLRDTFQR
jgi:iron(III) transport system substrate-binding protein